MRTRKFSKGQIKRTSEVLGNFAVAFVSAGAISPFFIGQANLDFLFPLVLSLGIGGILFFMSVYLMKDIK